MRGSATRTAITRMAPPFKTQGTLGLLLRLPAAIQGALNGPKHALWR